MKYLIVNADDFGMTKGINEGIVRAMREGIATDTSMLAAGGAFGDAVRLARANQIKELGAHLSVTILPNVVLRKETKNRGLFLLMLLSGRISEEDLRLEFKAQLDRIQEAGLEITHIDSHEHIHMLPRLWRIFIDLAREYNIPAIRSFRESRIIGHTTPGKIYRVFLSRYFSKKNEADSKSSGLFHPDHLLGFLDSGRLSEALLLEMLNSLDDGITELISHPGFLDPQILDDYIWHMNCEYELYALTSRRAMDIIEKRSIKLITYKEALRNESGGA